jgi:hypothetical protein
LGPAARGGVSCGRCFHTEAAWCAACGLQVKNRHGCTSVPLISGRNEKKKTQGPRNSPGAWRHASVWPFNLHYRVLASFFCIMYYETQKNATLRGEIGSRVSVSVKWPNRCMAPCPCAVTRALCLFFLVPARNQRYRGAPRSVFHLKSARSTPGALPMKAPPTRNTPPALQAPSTTPKDNPHMANN